MSSATVPIVRVATADDVTAMTDIYAYHVLNGSGTFEETPPSRQEMQCRFESREAECYPTLVSEVDGMVAGFAYAGNYKPRSAYRYTVEDSIYVAPTHSGKRVGQGMLEELIRLCTLAKYRQMMSVIGDSTNLASIRLHERCGFVHIGTASGLGYKFGRWLDVVYMQRSLYRQP